MRHRILTTLVVTACFGAAALVAQSNLPRVVPAQTNGSAIPLSTTSELTHGASAPTWTAVVGLTEMLRARTSLPTAVSNDQPVAGLANTTGARGVFPQAEAFGGDSGCPVTTTASTNAFNCKGSAGNVYEITAINPTATVVYLRRFNTASAPGTCSSSTGFVGPPIPIPSNSTNGAGFHLTYPVGRAFSTGISGCVSGDAAGTTNAAANAQIDIGYR